jgi:phage terminase small subunit
MAKRTHIAAARSEDGLTPRRRAFVRFYVESLNATDAARRAGYSARSAGTEGPDLLKNARVQEAIEREVAAKAPLLRAMVVEHSAAIGFSSIGDYLEFDHGGQEVTVLEDGTTVINELARVRLRPSKDLTTKQLAAVRKVTEHVSATGVRHVGFELHDKNGSLERLARLLNLFPRENADPLGGDGREVQEIRITYATGPMPDPAPRPVALQSEDDR